MVIIQTIVGILLALSAICFLLLAAFDKAPVNRQQAHASSGLEPGTGVPGPGHPHAGLAKLGARPLANAALMRQAKPGVCPGRALAI